MWDHFCLILEEIELMEPSVPGNDDAWNIFQVDDIEDKLDRFIQMYEEDRKRFATLPFGSPLCPPCSPMPSSPSPPYAAFQAHLPINHPSLVNSWKGQFIFHDRGWNKKCFIFLRLVLTDCVKRTKIENSLTGCILCCIKFCPTLVHFAKQITQIRTSI